jgi:signal transduction histidine kinase
MRTLIHDMRNELAVAIAHLEAMHDGKFTPTPERLDVVLQALNRLDTLIDGLRDPTPPAA